MSEVKYSKEHEWIKLDGDTAVNRNYTTCNRNAWEILFL